MINQKDRKTFKQWCFIASDGSELDLAKYLPKEDGVFINPTKHCRDVVKIYYTSYLDEYDRAMKMRSDMVNSIKI